MSDRNEALFPTRQAALSLPIGAKGMRRKLLWSLAILTLIAVVGGVISYLYLMQINRNLLRLVDADWPLERALMEMEINIGETAPAVLDYVREREQRHLDRMQESAVDFRRHAEKFAQYSATEEEHRVGKEVIGLYEKFTQLGDSIIVLADQRHAANTVFRSTAQELRQLLIGNPQPGTDSRTAGRETKLDPALALELLDAVAASAMYVAAPDPDLKHKYRLAAAKLRVRVAQHRINNVSFHDALLLRRIDDYLDILVRVADEIMMITDNVTFYLQDYSNDLQKIDDFLDNQIQPLIEAERNRVAGESKSATAKAVLLLVAMVGLALVIGGGSVSALSRASVEWRTSELKHELAERKKAEKKIQEARETAEGANRAKSVFLATMSHEIRTPLNGIIGMMDLLEYTPLNADQAQMIRTVNVSAYALLHIIGDILDFSKIEAGELSIEQIDISISHVFDSAMETLSQLAASKNIDLVVFVSPEVQDRVKGDPVRIRQILFNLVGNAIKFSEAEDGSRRVVAVRVDPCAGRNDGKVGIRFTVADSGIGISEDNMARIFTPFFQAEASTTRRFGGTGLGLSVCKKLVDLMGGTIGAKSRIGEGTTFTFEIPFDAVPGTAASEDSFSLTGVRVLVAFENSLSRSAVSTYLMYCGAAVIIASDIADAKQQSSIAAENRQPYNVAILCQTTPPATDAENEAMTALHNDLVSAGTGVVILTADRRNRNPVELPNTKHVHMRPLSRIALLRAVAAVAGKEDIAAVEQEENPRRTLSLGAVKRRSERILLAEDNAINQMVIQRQLNHLGFDVRIAFDGKEALHLLDQEKFDLLITDCHMPHMDGFELTETVRRRERESGTRLPIMAITANALRGDAERCFAAGMDDFLAKPVELTKMSETLDKWLRAIPTEQGVPAASPVTDLPSQRNEELIMRKNDDDAELTESKHPVDLAMLSRLLGTDDANSLRKIILFFWDTMAATPSELRRHFSARDAKSLRDAAHAAKGASASVGAVTASSLLKKLQFAAAHADWRQVEEILPEIDAAFIALKQYVGSLEAGSDKLSIRAANQA